MEFHQYSISLFGAGIVHCRQGDGVGGEGPLLL